MQTDIQEKPASSELIVLEKLTPAVIFAPGGVDDILAKIAREARSQHTDISTKAGREAVASLAYKVARSKSTLDKMGKELGETHYKSWKAITSERARIEKELDALKDEVRKPLTEWEDAEKQRIEDHEKAILDLEAMLDFGAGYPTSAQIKERIDALGARPARQWQEFVQRASDVALRVGKQLEDQHTAAVKREDEAAELARLRAEEIARQQKEHDDKIAAEAAERARAEAEAKAAREAQEAAAKAEVERSRVEQERADAIARAEKAEADRKAAAAKAEQDAKDAAEAAERNRLGAIETERRRAADEAARVAVETAKREANTKHRNKIHREIIADLCSRGFDEIQATNIVSWLANGEVPHTRISY